jgi:hypothetical protein
MPKSETFFAHRFAMFRDQFGRSWMLLNEKTNAAKCLTRSRRRTPSTDATHHSLVSSPAASASLACRESNVQNFFAFNSIAQARWRESSVRTPRVGSYSCTSLTLVSQTDGGRSHCDHTPSAQSRSNDSHACCA